MSQLDLFLHSKPQGILVPFPAKRYVSFPHAVAQRLASVDYAAGKILWHEVTRDFRASRRKEGRSKEEIQADINCLADQVHLALKSIELQKQYRAPAVILPMRADLSLPSQHDHGAGEAGTSGRGTKFLVGLGEAHEEYDAARGRDGGAA